MRKLILPLAALAATPALAADGYTPGYGFVSLYNTDFIVLIGFLLFIAILFYFNVPAMLGGMLDKRAQGIKADLDEARALREEAQALLASYERKSREVAEQAERIVAQAKADAEAAAAQARADLERSIARRVRAAEDQIASAEDTAVQSVRNRAVDVAIAVAGDTLSQGLAASDANALIDAAIAETGRRLH